MPPTKKPSTKQSKKKTKTTKAPAPAPAPAPVPAEVEEVSSPKSKTDDILNYAEEFESLSTALKDAMTLIKGLSSHVTKLEKQIAKDKKVVDKELKKKNKNAKKTDRVLNGFSKPGPVSDELKKFFDLGKDELIARTEITKKVTSYCQEHNLQNEKDKRIIKPNKDLKKLLRLNDKDELTYFNLQKYMKIHFPNKDGVFVHL